MLTIFKLQPAQPNQCSVSRSQELQVEFIDLSNFVLIHDIFKNKNFPIDSIYLLLIVNILKIKNLPNYTPIRFFKDQDRVDRPLDCFT